MRYFFLFYLLSYLLHSPLLAILVLGAVFYLSEAQYSGRYFNPAAFVSRHSEIRDLRARLAVNPHDAAAHNDLGRLLARQGKFEEGLEHMETAIKRMDESAETHYFLGLCRLETGDVERGRASIETALQLNPSFLYGEPRLTLARHGFEAGDFTQAAEQARACVKLNTSSVEGWLVLGRAAEKLGRSEEAAQAYRSALLAYDNLPHYLRLANRKWARLARRSARR